MALTGDPVDCVTVSVSEFRANCGPMLDAVRDGQDIIITKNGSPVAEIRPPRSPREEHVGSLFGFCEDIISLPDSFDFDEADNLSGHDETVDGVLASWEEEPGLVRRVTDL